MTPSFETPSQDGRSEKYECIACGGTGDVDDDGTPCEPCDGIGITAIDCPGCGRVAVPIHETVFVAAIPRTYCEPCGDREIERVMVKRLANRNWR